MCSLAFPTKNALPVPVLRQVVFRGFERALSLLRLGARFRRAFSWFLGASGHFESADDGKRFIKAVDVADLD